MASLRKIHTHTPSSENTGFGTNASNYGGRFLNKDGRPNIRKTGLGFLEKYSWFHGMLAMSQIKFFLVITLFYILVNLAFTLIYYSIGVEHLKGLETNSELEKFTEAFFFSSQTFTTVGYGRISPSGFLTNSVASFQALIGLLSFAVATGLMYGRFSKPTAYLKFAHNALLAPYKNESALMVRVAPFKNTTLTDAEATLTLGMLIEENGEKVNRFFNLKLELAKVGALTLSWTIVHPINEESPLFNFTETDFKNTKGEIIVFVKAFDDMFSNTVVSRSSYTFVEIIYGAKYKPMFHQDKISSSTILELDKLNDYEKVNLRLTPSINESEKTLIKGKM
ncbi:MAG: ion channel [Ferruginibacter sp.]